MNYKSNIFFVKTPNPRPKFNCIANFLWGKEVDYDSDGDASNPSDQNWTELTLEHRERLNERIDVDPILDNPLILKVKSENSNLSAQVAFYLAHTTNGEISNILNGDYVNVEEFRGVIGDFDVNGALERAED